MGRRRDIFGGNIYRGRTSSVYFCSKHICIQLKRCWCVCILLMVHLIQICSGDGSGELQDGNSVAKSNFSESTDLGRLVYNFHFVNI